MREEPVVHEASPSTSAQVYQYKSEQSSRASATQSILEIGKQDAEKLANQAQHHSEMCA
jgi:hypothetical protein